MGNGFNEWGIGVIEVTKEYLRTSVRWFLYRECDENFEHKFGEDFGPFPMVVHHEKIVKLRRKHLLGSFQNYVVERFDQKLDCQVVDRRCKVRRVPLWVED